MQGDRRVFQRAARRANLNRRIATSLEQPALRRIGFIKRTAGWAPVVWFPAMLVVLSLGDGRWAGAIGIGGVVFAGVLRGAVLLSRCPGCHRRYSEVEKGFREIWFHDRCSGCGLRRYSS